MRLLVCLSILLPLICGIALAIFVAYHADDGRLGAAIFFAIVGAMFLGGALASIPKQGNNV